MIIDVHTHLGDVLYPDGGDLVLQGKQRQPIMLDPQLIYEHLQWRTFPLPKIAFDQMLKASMVRSRSATIGNMRTAMARNNVRFCVTLPVPPNVTFEHLRAAYEKDPHILPFTGVDYAKLEDVDGKFSADVKNGARGLKLHPILQRVALNDPRTYATVEAFAPHNLPILFHSGGCEYYPDANEKHLAAPELGNIEDAAELIAAFPHVKFIVGHAGLDAVDTVMGLLGRYKNVWVDVSFQTPKRIRQLINVFGPDRVMYGSDWPWGNMWASLNAVNTACKDDHVLAHRLLCANANDLLLDPIGDTRHKPFEQPQSTGSLMNFETKNMLKRKVGAVLVPLMPKRVERLKKDQFSLSIGKRNILDALLRAGVAEQMVSQKRTNELSKYHQDFWAGDTATEYHSNLRGFVLEIFKEHFSYILAEIRALLEERPEMTTLVEIGCGGGTILKHLADELPGIEHFIGIDLAPDTIEENKQMFPEDRFEWIVADGKVWIEENGQPNTIVLSFRGVLEYFTQQALGEFAAHIATEMHPSALISIEPVGIHHDFASEPDSKTYGTEYSWSHNYPSIYAKSGLQLRHTDLQNHSNHCISSVVGISPQPETVERKPAMVA